MVSGVSTSRLDTSLRRRTLTALVLGPAVIAACLFLSPAAFAAFLGVAFLLAAWEWAALSGYQGSVARALFVAVLGVCMLVLWVLPDGRWWLVAAAVPWWLGQALHLALIDGIETRPGPQPLLLVTGIMVLPAPWAAAIELRGGSIEGPFLLLLLFVLIWTADSLAYFVGRRFGRRKLAPVLSPGKSWEGVYGALAGGLLWGLVLGSALGLGTFPVLLSALLCAATVLVSVVGDLFESLLKRRRGVKDSSRLLPGHGGMLDRIDSLIAAAPVFAVGLYLMGVIR